MADVAPKSWKSRFRQWTCTNTLHPSLPTLPEYRKGSHYMAWSWSVANKPQLLLVTSDETIRSRDRMIMYLECNPSSTSHKFGYCEEILHVKRSQYDGLGIKQTVIAFSRAKVRDLTQKAKLRQITRMEVSIQFLRSAHTIDNFINKTCVLIYSVKYEHKLHSTVSKKTTLLHEQEKLDTFWFRKLQRTASQEILTTPPGSVSDNFTLTGAQKPLILLQREPVFFMWKWKQ